MLQVGLQTVSTSAAAGTYQGLIQKLDYLQNLGINAIELQPVQEFNELEYYEVSPRQMAWPDILASIHLEFSWLYGY